MDVEDCSIEEREYHLALHFICHVSQICYACLHLKERLNLHIFCFSLSLLELYEWSIMYFALFERTRRCASGMSLVMRMYFTLGRCIHCIQIDGYVLCWERERNHQCMTIHHSNILLSTKEELARHVFDYLNRHAFFSNR